jgi:hypothetical protein
MPELPGVVMKIALLLPLAVAAFIGAARAEEPDDIREVTPAEASAFNARIYAGPPGKTAYACFVRRYDADHLAQHPKQKVASMKLLVSAETFEADNQLHNSFRLGFRYRNRNADFDSSGSCHHAVFTKGGDEVRLGCGVDCEGGGLGIALSKDDKSAVVRLESIRIWLHNKATEGEDRTLVAGQDDGIFRLDRVDNSECAALAYDRKELAALRHK